MQGFDDDDAGAAELMDEWGIVGGDATADDIGAYVAAKQQRRRIRDDRQNFAPASKLYGYQEPKSVARVAQPRVLPSLDNGGWNSNTGTGAIPKYAWQDDPLRKKAIPGVASTSAKVTARSTNARQQRINALAAPPARRAEPASAPAASGHRVLSQPPRLAVSRNPGPGVLSSGAPRSGRNGVLPPLQHRPGQGAPPAQHPRGRSVVPVARGGAAAVGGAPRRSQSSEAPRSGRARDASVARRGSAQPTSTRHHDSDDDDDDANVPVPAQHPYRGTLAQQAKKMPPMNRAVVAAYSNGLTLARKRVAALKAPSPRSHQPSPRKAAADNTPRRATDHYAWGGTAAVRRPDDGGEEASRQGRSSPRKSAASAHAGPRASPRRPADSEDGGGSGGDGEDMESPRPVPAPPEPTPSEVAAAAIARLRGMIAMERQERLQLTDSISCAQLQLEESKAATQRETAQQKQMQKAQKVLVAAERERNSLLATKRKKDIQLRELRAMASNLGQRVDELRVEAAMSVVKSPRSPRRNDNGATASRPSEMDEIGDRMALRDTAKSKAALKQSIERLKEEQLYLQDEIARVQAAASDRQQRDALLHDRIHRERTAAVVELKERLAAELDRELARMRENHVKAARHREREIEQRVAEEERLADAHTQRVSAAIVGGGAASKSVAEVRIALATQTGIVDELTRQTDALQRQHEECTAALIAKRKAVTVLNERVRSLEKQLEVSATAIAGSGSGSAAYAPERAQLQEKVAAATASEKAGIAKLSAAETDLEHLRKELAEKRQAANERASAARQEADAAKAAADAKTAAAKATRDEAAARLAAATAAVKAAKGRKKAADVAGDMSAKDSEIERLTKQVAFATAARKDATTEGEQLLRRLDEAERLVSMSALH